MRLEQALSVPPRKSPCLFTRQERGGPREPNSRSLLSG